MEIMIGILCLLIGMVIGSLFCIALIKWAFEYEKKLFELIVADETHDPVVYTNNVTVPDSLFEAGILNRMHTNVEGDTINESKCEYEET